MVRMITVRDRRLADVLVDMLRRHDIQAVAELRAGGQLLDLSVREVDAARARTVLPLDAMKAVRPNGRASAADSADRVTFEALTPRERGLGR